MTTTPGQGGPGSDAGHASVFAVLLMPVVLMVFALVWEAGQMLVAKSEVMAAAHEAARAGAHQIDTVAARQTGEVVLDQTAAADAAQRYLHGTGATGGVRVDDDRVAVLARVEFTPVLLPMGTRVIEAEATAAAARPDTLF